MRRSLILMALFLLIGGVAFTQNTIEKAKYYEQEADSIVKKLDAAMLYLDSAEAIYKSLNDSGALGNYFVHRSVTYLRHRKAKEAIVEIKKGLQYTKNRSLDSIAGRLYGDLVYAFSMTSNSDSSIAYGWEGLKRLQNSTDKKGIAFLYMNLYQPYNFNGQVDSSILVLNKAMKLYREIGDLKQELKCMTNMSFSYGITNQYDKSLELLNSALELCLKHKLKRQWYVRLQIGRVYSKLGKDKEAIKFLMEGINHPQHIAAGNILIAKIDLGRIYLKQGKSDEGIALIKECFETFEREGNHLYASAPGVYLMEAYNNIQEYDKAIAVGERVKNLNGFWTNRLNRVQYYNKLRMAYKGKGDYKSAYKYLEVAERTDDSVKASSFEEKIANAEIEFNTMVKEKEIEVLRLDKENLEKAQEISDLKSARKSYAIYGMSGGMLSLVIVAWLIISRKQKALLLLRKEKELKEKEKELEAQRSLHMRLKALRAQLNPHFIFNSLASVQSFMLKNEVNKTIEYIGAFARLMRNTLDNSEETFIPLEDELAVLKDYVMLEQIRLSGGFEFDCEVEEGLEFDAMVPTMLIQPYLENAIWHGLSNKLEGEKRLLLSFTSSEDVMKCVVEDNGAGREFTKEKARDHKSHSMRINQARLDLLNSLEGNIAKVEIEDKYEGTKPTGTRVIITLPLEL